MKKPISNNELLNIRDNLMPQAIRATAGLLYWFAKEADLLPPPPLSVSISGPTTAPGAVGTWTANVSGGYPPYSYQWYHKWTSDSPLFLLQSKTVSNKIIPMVAADTWYPQGTNSPTLNLYLNGGNSYLRVDVTDNTGTFVSAQYYVAGAGGDPGIRILPKTNDEGKDIIAMSKKEMPKDYNISQNYPNPFNPSTEIKYALKDAGFVTIKVYDVLGRVVATLVNENKPAGYYTVNFDASRLSSGIYFYGITANGFTAVKKMILTK